MVLTVAANFYNDGSFKVKI